MAVKKELSGSQLLKRYAVGMSSNDETAARDCDPIRKTDDGRICLIDCISAAAINPKSRRKTMKKTLEIIESSPVEDRPVLTNHRFVGHGEMLVGCLHDIARFLAIMPVRRTNARKEAMRTLLIRLGGDEALVNATINKTHTGNDEEVPPDTDEIDAQLATELGCSIDDLCGIRRTSEGVVSLIDLTATFQNKCRRDAKNALYLYCKSNAVQFESYKFDGRGQRETPVAKISEIYDILVGIPDDRSLEARQRAAGLLSEYLASQGSQRADDEDGSSKSDELAMPKAYETTRLSGMCDPRHLYLGTSTSRADLVKVGVTERLGERAQEHARRAGDFQFFHVFFNAGCLEARFKQVFAPYQEKIEIAGQTQTEYFRLSKEAAVAGVLTTAKMLEREAEAMKSEQTMEREHKRRRLEIETASLEAEAQHRKQCLEMEAEYKRRCAEMDAEHKRLRLEIETRRRASRGSSGPLRASAPATGRRAGPWR